MGILGSFHTLFCVVVGGERLDLLRQVGQLGVLGSFHTLFCLVVGGERLDLLRQVSQLGVLGSFHTLFCLVVGGQDDSLLAQGVDLSLHDVEALALRRFPGLRRVVVGGERLDLLRQVG